MKAIDEKCCICGKEADYRSVDGTAGWCGIHYWDWRNFLRRHRKEYDGLADAFPAWLEQARAESESEMTSEEMRSLILSRIPSHPVTHHQLWQLCGSPQHPDNFLFDVILVRLAKNDAIQRGEDPTERFNTYWKKKATAV